MPVHYIIFRLDFSLNSNIVSFPGRVMEILLEEKLDDKEFLPDILDDPQKESFLQSMMMV